MRVVDQAKELFQLTAPQAQALMNLRHMPVVCSGGTFHRFGDSAVVRALGPFEGRVTDVVSKVHLTRFLYQALHEKGLIEVVQDNTGEVYRLSARVLNQVKLDPDHPVWKEYTNRSFQSMVEVKKTFA